MGSEDERHSNEPRTGKRRGPGGWRALRWTRSRRPPPSTRPAVSRQTAGPRGTAGSRGELAVSPSFSPWLSVRAVTDAPSVSGKARGEQEPCGARETPMAAPSGLAGFPRSG